jgi:hypothetical protein
MLPTNTTLPAFDISPESVAVLYWLQAWKRPPVRMWDWCVLETKRCRGRESVEGSFARTWADSGRRVRAPVHHRITAIEPSHVLPFSYQKPAVAGQQLLEAEPSEKGEMCEKNLGLKS